MVFLDGAKNAALWILIGIVVTELTLFLGPRSALGQRIPVRGDWLYWIWVVMWPAPGIHLAMTLFFLTGFIVYKSWVGFTDGLHAVNVLLYQSWTHLIS